ncbi:hypothetical protein LMG667_03435 [Xanthomonas euvesicatoria]|uniref:hypothetical protein n=1 Tax=Xanthomonas euvesicatoria TaxID=456327 RepID=UPI00080DFAA7|nr:hypothetical protein [Xanthomonas euvesicatoria]OCG90036.1 hypothetical protein LMG667_03435 [Xanthomonas euvesicatoria]
MRFIASLIKQFKAQSPVVTVVAPVAAPAPIAPGHRSGIHEVMGRPKMDVQTLAKANDLRAMDLAGRVAAEALGLVIIRNPRAPGFMTQRTGVKGYDDWRLVHTGRSESEVYAGLGIDAMRVATCRNDAGTMRFVNQGAVDKLEAALPRRIEQYDYASLRDMQEEREELEQASAAPSP